MDTVPRAMKTLANYSKSKFEFAYSHSDHDGKHHDSDHESDGSADDEAVKIIDGQSYECEQRGDDQAEDPHQNCIGIVGMKIAV